MDLSLVYMFLLPILSYIALNLFYQKTKTSSKQPNANLPPGCTGLPVLGETVALGMYGRKGIPERFFQERMKKYNQQVFTTSLIGEKMAVLCGIKGNKFLFANGNKLASTFWPRTLLKIFPHAASVTNRAEESLKIRHFLTEYMNPEYLKKCVVIVDGVAKKHFDSKWDSQSEVNTLSLVKEYSFAVICKLFLSIDDSKSLEGIAKPFHHIISGIFGIPVNLPGMAFNKGIKASNLIREKLFEIIRERKAHLMAGNSPWSEDVMWNMIMEADLKNRFTTDLAIADIVILYFFGSLDSTKTAIIFLVKYLAEFPQVYQDVLKEQRSILKEKQSSELNWKDLQMMKYSWSVASEVMRLMPPAPGFFREAVTDFTYSGFSIPKGWKLYWTPHTTHKDPQYFPEPEKFDPSRFEGKGPAPYTYVPFGGGSRICPGKDFARIIILVFLHNLVQRFHWEKLIPNEKILVQPSPVLAKGLPIRLHPHH